jgi:hypothetical protein
MTPAVMTHTPIQATEVRLHRIPTHIADQFHQVMDQAEHVISTHEIRALHAQAALLIGMALPASREIVRCNCQGCYCDRVVDARTVRTYLNGTVEFVQCETCAEDHYLTGQ